MTYDWDLDGPGMEYEPASPPRRAGSSVNQRLHNAWRDAMADTGVVQVCAPRAIFNKHAKELLAKVDEEAILEGFKRFAADVRAGRVQVTKTAWFVFYGRREKYLSKRRKRVVEGDWDAPAVPEGDGWDSFALPEEGW
jgi:hypothetical protein